MLAASDVLFFTLPDKEIESVYRQISQLSIRGKIFCHCSGALSAQDAFPNIDDFSATGFSVHPLFAVSDKYNAYRELADVFFYFRRAGGKISIYAGVAARYWSAGQDNSALAVQEAGAFALTLECIPAPLAKLITDKLDIPTIGIGAGAGCDGQILVYQDMLGLFSDYTPKFAKHFAELGQEMQNAFAAYVHEVQAGTFPAAEHTFNMNEDVMNKLY